MSDSNMGDAAKRKAASECYRKGNEALEKSNWDYALDMFATCTALVPDNVMYRQLAHGSRVQEVRQQQERCRGVRQEQAHWPPGEDQEGPCQ